MHMEINDTIETVVTRGAKKQKSLTREETWTFKWIQAANDDDFKADGFGNVKVEPEPVEQVDPSFKVWMTDKDWDEYFKKFDWEVWLDEVLDLLKAVGLGPVRIPRPPKTMPSVWVLQRANEKRIQITFESYNGSSTERLVTVVIRREAIAVDGEVIFF